MLAAGFATQPVVVVYPLVASQGTPVSVGMAVSGVLSTTIASHGDITVKGAPSDTQQADVLSVARKLGADYYVTGFVTEIGNQVSAVEQLVGTKSGVIVWRTTATYAIPDDAGLTGDQLRAAILQAENPGFTSMSGGSDNGAAPAPPGAQRRGPAPKPEAPLPIPVTYVPPTSGPDAQPQSTGPHVLVVDFDGTAMDAVKHYVPISVLRTLPRYNMSGSSLDITSADVAAEGIVACAQSGADLLMDGTISADQGDPEMGWSFDANLKMKVYSCRDLRAKPLVIEKEVDNGNLQTAVDIAVDQALKDLAYAQKTANR